jgi:hypothetical protein
MIPCDKTTLMLSAPPCFRPATQALELEATRGPLKGVTTTVSLCDPCAGMLSRMPGLKPLSTTPIEPTTPTCTRRERIESHLDDMITDLFYYDRKEDENLPVGSIEEAVKAGEITEAEIVERVAARVREALDGRV